MKPVRIGVIGYGVIGRQHLQAATESPLIEIAAVADLIEENRQMAAKTYSSGRIYQDGMDLIADPEVEAVVLALPAVGRLKLALEAFKQGKHVLTEKPVAMNADDVRRMITARGELKAACCSSRYRFSQGARLVTDFIGGGALGTLRLVRCRATVPAGKKPDTPRPEWRLKKSLNGGGILVNWGCYDLDYLLGITSWKLIPRTVFAQVWPIPPRLESHIAPGSDAETYYTALIRCEDGTVISLERGEYMPAGEEPHAWQIIGTNGSLRLNMTAADSHEAVWDDISEESGIVTQKLWEGEKSPANIHGGPVTDFAAAIREDRDPKTTLEQALMVQQITDAIYESARSGASVTI